MRVLGVLIALGITAYACYWAVAIRRKRQALVRIGADLIHSSQVVTLYHHDLQATRTLERILQHDRVLPILSDEDRVEAERLVKAFYDDRGE